jgi:amino acid transporter
VYTLKGVLYIMLRTFYRWLIGKPLDSGQVENERIPKWKALPIFSSDALSSVGYGPEQIAIVLAAMPALGLYSYFGAVVIAIIILLGIVALSYSQVIKANPGGGGSYAIAMKYLGEYPALVAGAALFSDYILTVAVSISSGTAAITSAFPVLAPYHIYLDVFVLVGILMIFNLRGVQEASTVFVWPTYIFLGCMFATIFGGLYQIIVLQTPSQVVAVQSAEPLSAFTILILLRAFANGCSSMTGVEAIADGVPLFKVPQERNAMVTTVIMASILAFMLGGIGYLVIYFHLLPMDGFTLMSILVEEVFGHSIMFYFVQIMTMVILYLAANTAFNGLPPLLSFMARDGYVPRYLGNRGERLSFSNGIILLTLAAAFLIVVFQGNVEHLISLYAVGVFLSFTIAQTAMVVHWNQTREKNWKLYAFINGTGAIVTALVVVIVLLTKFIYGAWIVVLLIPTLVFMYKKVHHHYDDVREQLVLTKDAYKEVMSAEPGRNIIVIPVASPTQAVARAIRYAKIISNYKIYAVHVCTDEAKGEKVKRLWAELEPSIEMVLIPSPYRQLTDPLIRFIIRLRRHNGPHDIITVLIPEFEPKKLWHRLLHNQSGWLLRIRMLNFLDVVVSTVPLKFKK